MGVMPKWADVVLVPLISLIIAAPFVGFSDIGHRRKPCCRAQAYDRGRAGAIFGLGLYALLYAPTLSSLGLRSLWRFTRALFNIGGEGQAMMGGLGVALVCLFIPWPHWTLALLGATLGQPLFGALWAAMPAYLAGQTRQSHRDHHHHVQFYRGCGPELRSGQVR